jgi:two-component system phosphate regulon sensor histidine kinase PhoR
LTAVKGYADLAYTVLDNGHPQASEFIRLASKHTEVLNRMIIQMLDVTEMARGGFEITPGAVNIGDMIHAVIEEHQSLIREKGHNLQVHFGPLDTYIGDGERLKWALWHVLKNACDYTLPGGTIVIYAGREGDSCVVRVRDTGVGISPRDQPRVFEQFFRGYPVAEDGTVIDVRGTGLGLFVVDRVVRAHGGEVTFRSKRGVGSEFTINLPYTAEPQLSGGDGTEAQMVSA